MSNQFKPGDRIKYVGRDPRYHDKQAIGRLGTVQEYFDGTGTIAILLDGAKQVRNVFRENIELDATAVKVSVPLQYELKQKLVDRIVKAERERDELDYELLKSKRLQHEAQALSMQAERDDYVAGYAAGYAKQREKVEHLERQLKTQAAQLTDARNRIKAVRDAITSFRFDLDV